MTTLKIINMKIEDLKPAEYNPRLDLQPGDDEYEKIRRSVKEFGLVEPIVVNERTGNIVGGHQRYKVIKELGYEEIPVSVVDLDEDKEKMLNIALNKITGDWDNQKLKDLLQELDTGENDMDLTGFDHDELEDLMTEFYEEDPVSDYTDKIKAPIYEPTQEEQPDIEELFNEEKSQELIERIEDSEIPDEIKDFLIKASYRHIVFNYANIAEYYAHADKETQELMEESALVIIDFNKAIENGYATLLGEVEAMRDEDEQ